MAASYQIFEKLRRKLPEGMRTWLGSTSLLAPVRDRMIRQPDGRPRLATAEVESNGERFVYTGSFQQVEQAQRRGIEVIISRVGARLISDGCVALDVGGNYGFLAMLMGRKAAPSGMVVSFEADGWTADVLRKSIADNGLADICKVVEGFVGTVDDGTGHSHVTIDATVERMGITRVDFLKIDVDGGDFDVLKGAAQTIERFHPPLVVELTEPDGIVEWLSERYPLVTDMRGNPVDPANWPPNVFASLEPLPLGK